MKNTTSARGRFAVLGFAVLAISASTVGTANAVRILPETPSMLAPAPTDIAVTKLVTSVQADNVHAALRDLRSQLSAH